MKEHLNQLPETEIRWNMAQRERYAPWEPARLWRRATGVCILVILALVVLLIVLHGRPPAPCADLFQVLGAI